MCNFRDSLRKLAFCVPFVGRRYRDLRRAAESHYRVNPGHYASPIPSPSDIDRETSVVAEIHCDSLPGIPLNTGNQLSLLSDLSSLMTSHPFGPDPGDDHRYHFENDWFQFTDALVLHALLRHFRPTRVVEIGSGYSSCVILDTLDGDEHLDTELTMIEPNSERLHARLRPEDETAVTLVDTSVQDAARDRFTELASNDILLVDSSHISKCGSDVNLIIHDILPALASGVIVHFHDIFFPFTYPRHLLESHQYWNEAYLLRAFLCQNEAFEILLWNDYLKKQQGEAMSRALGQDHNDIACSFWMRRR